MKIEIECFGPIERFSYDLDKDFIVTYGNNNIGKSYAMQIVYLLLKAFIQCSEFQMIGHAMIVNQPMDFMATEEEYVPIVKEFMHSTEKIKDITDLVTSEIYKVFQGMFLKLFMESCKNTFGNFEKNIGNAAKIHVIDKEFSFYIDLGSQQLQGDMLTAPFILKKSEKFVFQSPKNFHKEVYVYEDCVLPARIISGNVIMHFRYWLQRLRNVAEDVYFLPASRSGIYSGMNAFSSIIAELSKNRMYLKSQIQIPKISEPISDYFLALSNINAEVNNVELRKYYTEIENSILKGKVTFNQINNTLQYKPDNINASFEMPEVSSMVSEVSPIVAFLKYVLKKQNDKDKAGKSILFIEEPEAHLHPNNQIQLVEIFAEMIHADVKLIMSSHSNYIFNKLNNLVLSKKLDYNVYQPIILEEHQNGSISKVLPIDELGAEDENFIDVSEKLYNEREAIIEQLNMEE